MPKAKVKFAARAKAHRASAPKNPSKGQALMLLPDYGPLERWQHGARTYHVDGKPSK